jgi:hypothetical protein
MSNDTNDLYVVNFHKDAGGRLKLFGVAVLDAGGSTDFYDVDWSRTYRCYVYHMSGCGGFARPLEVDGIYYASVGAPIRETPSRLVDERSRRRNATRRLARLPKAFSGGENILRWLEQNGINDEAIWCAACRDWLPGSDLCRHVWWCDRTGAYSTPDERCACATRSDCRD